MASLNKVFLMGNLTRDPELRYTLRDWRLQVSELRLTGRGLLKLENKRKKYVMSISISSGAGRRLLVSISVREIRFSLRGACSLINGKPKTGKSGVRFVSLRIISNSSEEWPSVPRKGWVPYRKKASHRREHLKILILILIMKKYHFRIVL